MAKTLSHDRIVTSAASKAGVVITRDDLDRIRSCGPGSELAKWIEQNLTTKTLLSSEELQLSNHASQPGRPEEVEYGREAVPLLEEDLLRAIADLDLSTDALSRQSQALQAQQTLVEHRNGRSSGIRNGESFVDQIEQRNLANVQRLKAEIQQFQDEVEGLLRATQETVDRASKKIPSMMTELANSNDRTLDGLTMDQLVAAAVEQSPSISLETIDSLAAALSTMVVEELQTRLDRTYLESLHESSSSINGDSDEVFQDVLSLEQDLKSLYTEIPDVAAIHAAQKYTEPLVWAVGKERNRREALAELRRSRVTGQLSSMTLDLEQLTEKLRAFHSYRCVIQKLWHGYDHLSIGEKSDIHSLTKTLSQSSQEPGTETEALLRHFGIPVPASSGLHESVDGKVANLRDNMQQSKASIEREARKVLEIRKMIIESFLQDTDQGSSESLSKLDALDARVTRLREQVQPVSGADRSRTLRRQRIFTEKWS